MPAAPGTALEDLDAGAEHRQAPAGAPAPAGRLPAWLAVAWERRAALLVVTLTALLAVPLVVALGVLRQPRWFPTLDIAWTELRVRDVASDHPPLVGLAGRIGTENQGSHPGPLSFWAMWPFYQLFGATSWALQAAGVAMHVAAMSVAVWIAHRRGGAALALGVAAVLVVLARAHGAGTLAEPWNPWLPLFWWMVLLLAVWSVVCGDLPLLPVTVFAASFCMQTHIPYVGIAGALLGLAAGAAALAAYRSRRDPAERRRFLKWGLLAAGVGVVVWIPPVIDELTNTPGNLSIIKDYFSDPGEDPIGMRQGVELLLVRLNVFRLAPHLVPDSWALSESTVPGVGLVVAWAAAAVMAWRLRHRALTRLHLVLGASLVLAAVSLSRIFGVVWYYLSLWVWGIALLMLVAIGWTVSALVERRLSRPAGRRAATVGKVALGGVTILFAFLFTIDAAYVQAPAADLSSTVAGIAPSTVDALAKDGSRDDGEPTYLVSWTDPISIGSLGYGLFLELEREGFDVGAAEPYQTHPLGVTRHRLLDAEDADAEVHLSVGPDIATWRAKPDVEQVAAFDPRSPEERGEYERLRAEVVDELTDAGLSDLVPGVDENLFTTSLDPRIPSSVHDRMVRMLDLGLPTAVFVGPPDAAG